MKPDANNGHDNGYKTSPASARGISKGRSNDKTTGT